ncbi:branched-chain amino acid ABC transporter permease [Brevibacillus sp. B_LB10_24]|uniref:branched-chain amino acid ABC transporter permease n=1 Tax=Brevibacillus sp. B_LB10_24 TaxID=3380645 RepID=UPI0038BBD924
MDALNMPFQLLVSGLAMGSIYALVALGFVLVYVAVNVVNFAQGDFAMMGAFITFTLVSALGLPIWIGLLVGVIVIGLFGYLFQLGVYRPFRNRKKAFLPVMISTLGASMVLQSVFLLIYGPYPQKLPTLFTVDTIKLGEVAISTQYLAILGFALLLFLFQYIFFEKTMIGKQMQATAQDPDTARLMGINVSRMHAITFIYCTALGGIAGILVAPVFMITHTMGPMIGLKAFASAIVGGLSDVKGAIMGGLAIGVIETFAAAYISGPYKDAFAFLVLVLFLIFRPSGIFGEKVGQKA